MSVRCVTASLSKKYPTAQTSSDANAAAPSNQLANQRPAGGFGFPFGLGTTLQLVPSQCSVSVRRPERPTPHTSPSAITATPAKLSSQSGLREEVLSHRSPVHRAAIVKGPKYSPSS